MNVRIKVFANENQLTQVQVVNVGDLDIASVQNKMVVEWFHPSNGRDGWEGLIQEVKNLINDEEAELCFEFEGPKEQEKEFQNQLRMYGLSIEEESKEENEEYHMREAQKAEHRGLINEAFKEYKMAADYNNNPDAQCWIGHYYNDLCNETENEEKQQEYIRYAIDYFEKAAEQKKGYCSFDAMFQLHIIWFSDEYIKADWREAGKWFERKEECRGYSSAEALLCIGDYWYDGDYDSDEKDFERAVDWYQKAADKGMTEAQYKLGQCYFNGEGVKEDKEKAFRLYIKASEGNKDYEGYPKAQNKLAICYMYGYGTSKDDQKGLKWFQTAAENGYAAAQCNLGETYRTGGLGLEIDENKAFKWYQKAADQGYAKAKFWEAFLIVNKDIELEEGNSAQKAFSLFQEAAAQAEQAAEGEIWGEGAVWWLAWSYQYGVGTEENYDLAREWYEKGATAGSAISQYNVATMYENGWGCDRNIDTAIEWYTKSAEQDRLSAQRDLGKCYLLHSTEEDHYEKAFIWLQKAAEREDQEAQYWLAKIYYHGWGQEEDDHKAMKWFELASQNGSVDAKYMLGVMFEKGYGTDVNINKAYEWYKEAADCESPNQDACLKIADNYYEQIDSGRGIKTAGAIAVAALIPITNLVTIPAGIIGSTMSKHIKFQKFLESDAGKDMMKYYERAAELGSAKAKEKIEELKGYM